MAQLPDWASHVSRHDSFAVPEVPATCQEHLQEARRDVRAGECLEAHLDDVSSGCGWCNHEAMYRFGATASLWKKLGWSWRFQRFQSRRCMRPDQTGSVTYLHGKRRLLVQKRGWSSELLTPQIDSLPYLFSWVCHLCHLCCVWLGAIIIAPCCGSLYLLQVMGVSGPVPKRPAMEDARLVVT